jgi:P27 family predicted phage terminase small subunit
LRGIAPEIPQTVPDPPSFLTPAAAEEWRRLAPELVRLGLLTGLDVMPLAVYCQAFGTWCDASQAGAAEDVAPDARRELAGVARGAMRDMVRYARLFGMTPSSRAAAAGGALRDTTKFDGLIG